MTPLTLANLILLVFVIFLLKTSTRVGSGILKHAGLLELSWIGFQCMLWLVILFDVLEGKRANQSFTQVAGRENMTLLSTLIGFIIVHVVLSSIIAHRLFSTQSLNRQTAVN